MANQADWANRNLLSLAYVNSLGQAWLTADPLGNRDRYNFDGKGNVTEVVYPDNSFASYSYNSFAEPISYRGPTGTTYIYGYDSHGNLEGEGGLLGLVGYTYTYNTAGLVTGMTDALGHTWTYSYNTLGELTGATDPLHATQSWSYDTAGDVTAYTNQDGFQTTYSYDSRATAPAKRCRSTPRPPPSTASPTTRWAT